MEEYKEELSDENSRYYKLFSILSRVNSIESFQIFFIFFTNIDRDIFTIEDYFVFLDNQGLELDYESIVRYVSDLKINKINIISEKLKNGLYELYGNLYNYIKRRNIDKNDTIFYRANNLEDEIFNTNEKFLFSAYIDYFNVNAYRNKVQAEKDYWTIITEYSGIFSTKTTINFQMKKLLGILTEKDYDNTNGLAVFLRKDLNKNLFFNDNELDILMSSLLKNSYTKFSYTEIKDYIEKMSEEIVEYYEIISATPFDYSKESTMMPDISDFLLYKAEKLSNNFLTMQKITYNDFKEINFYYSVMFEFANINTASGHPNLVKQRYTEISSLYENARTEILDLWNYIKANGKYL